MSQRVEGSPDCMAYTGGADAGGAGHQQDPAEGGGDDGQSEEHYQRNATAQQVRNKFR